MNINDALLEEHSKVQTLSIVKYIGNHKDRFKILVGIFFSNEHLLSQRAAWVLSYCVEEHPELIKPYLKKMVANLEKKELHDAVKRSTLRFLQVIDIPVDLHGKLLDISYGFALSKDEPVAIKAFALRTIYNISKNEPDLLRELKTVTHDLAAHADSPAILSVCKHINRRN